LGNGGGDAGPERHLIDGQNVNLVAPLIYGVSQQTAAVDTILDWKKDWVIARAYQIIRLDWRTLFKSIFLCFPRGCY
jgi:hypothetical protein